MNKPEICTIAIVGCGTVGTAAAQILLRDEATLSEKTGLTLRLKYIVVRDLAKAQQKGLPDKLFTTDLEMVLNDQEVDIVAELIGGTDTALDLSKRVLSRGKHLVTANKALLAHHGAELFALARKNNTAIAFEASCGGGIPIVRAFYDGLTANRIDAFYGIVNGTCNYILSEMIEKGQTYSEALKGAQEGGLAEADPTLDVNGGDSAHKLAILSSLAFGQAVKFEDLTFEGIDRLELTDVNFARELGYTVKLLAIAQRRPEGLSLRVKPSLISQDHPLAWVSGSFNAVSVYGSTVGHTMYYGRGAGGSPTASAVVSDMISLATGTYQQLFNTLKIWPDQGTTEGLLSRDEIQSRYYLRFMAEDKPGVLAAVSELLSLQGISITQALQKEPHGEGIVPIVMTTRESKEGQLLKALEEIREVESIHEIVCLGIIEEPKEQFDL